MNSTQRQIAIRACSLACMLAWLCGYETRSSFAITIDSFDQGGFSMMTDTAHPDNDFVELALPNVIGGGRESFVFTTLDPHNATFDLNRSVPGSAILSADAGARWDVQYGADRIPQFDSDFTDGGISNAFAVHFQNSGNSGLGLFIAMNMEDAHGGGGAAGGIFFPMAGLPLGPVVATIPFSQISTQVGMDFHHVSLILLSLSGGGNGSSYEMTLFDTIAVPEPATLTLLVSAILVIGGIHFLRRRRRMAR